MPTPLTKAEALQVERWFRRHGLISMTRGTGYAASTARLAAPVLVLLFVGAMVLAAVDSPELEIWQGLVLALVTILVTWLLANRVRHRPLLSPVERIGTGEALAFVVVPALVRLATPQSFELSTGDLMIGAEGRVVGAVFTVLLQLALLFLVWAFIVSGVGSLASLLLRQISHTMSEATGALAAVIPVLLGFVFFFFFNPGVWFAISDLDGWSFVGLVGFLVLLAGLFLGSRQQFQLAPLRTFETTEDLHAALVDTPLAEDVADTGVPARTPLDWRQAANLRVVAVLSRLVTAAVLGLVVFAIFLILGFIALGPTVIETWTKQPANALFSLSVGGKEHVLAWQHIKIAGFLAAFSGFNYGLVSATDARLRQTATDTASHIVRTACALRLCLLARPAHPRADVAPTA